MKVLVTGAAGFIGSQLCQKLLQAGCRVVGVDNFLPNYPKAQKLANLKDLERNKSFKFVADDLLSLNLQQTLRRVSVIFHLAGQPGVRDSWGDKFKDYTRNNIEATQCLLEAATNCPLDLFVYASTSSVYGYEGQLTGPLAEDVPLHPFSPYGVSKLAAEHLCSAYYRNQGLPTVALRFFSVYGPRQRPDMGFHQMILKLLRGEPLSVHSGDQRRDFTYVDDIVNGNLATLLVDRYSLLGQAINLGGGRVNALSEAIEIMARTVKREAQIIEKANPHGNVKATWADISLAQRLLNYQPTTDLETGLEQEINWIRNYYHL